MTNWGYKAVRKVLQTFGGAELAQQQSGRITGVPGNPEVATLARRAGAESCVLLKNNNHTLPLDLSAPVALFGRVQKNYFYVARYWPPMKAGAPPLSTTRTRDFGGTGPAIMQKCR